MIKKYIVGLLVIVTCITSISCGKKDNQNDNKDWIIDNMENEVMLDDDVRNTFDIAVKEYKEIELKPVALLAQQVVSGTNYMFLSVGKLEEMPVYKVLVVYKNLEGVISLTHVSDFDVKKYVNENNSLTIDNLIGGWQTNIPGKPFYINEKVQKYFDKATEKIVGVSYFPITILAHQDNSKTNYAVLCYGRIQNQNQTEGIYVLTLHIDENDKSEITSIAAVDLKQFNN